MMKKLKFLKTNDIYNIYTFMMIMNKYKQSKQTSISFIIFNIRYYKRDIVLMMNMKNYHFTAVVFASFCNSFSDTTR